QAPEVFEVAALHDVRPGDGAVRQVDEASQRFEVVHEGPPEALPEAVVSTMFAPGSPASTFKALRAAASAMRSDDSRVAAPRCDVARKLGNASSGEPVGGSCSKASLAAALTRPSPMARARASSSINPPRAVLMMITPGF